MKPRSQGRRARLLLPKGFGTCPMEWRGSNATIWILARIVYLPIYLLGIIYVRTAVWVISIIGLLMMLGRLAGY